MASRQRAGRGYDVSPAVPPELLQDAGPGAAAVPVAQYVAQDVGRLQQGVGGQGVPPGVEGTVDGRRRGCVPVLPWHLIEGFVGVLAGEQQPVVGTQQGVQQVVQNARHGGLVGRLLRELVGLQVGYCQVRVGNQHLLVVRHLPVAADRVAEEPLVFPVVDAVPHPLEGGLHHSQKVAVSSQAVAGGQEAQGFPGRLLRFQAETTEPLVIKLLQPLQHGIGRSAGAGVGGGSAALCGLAGCRDRFATGHLLQQRGHLVRRRVGPAGQKLTVPGQQGH